MSLMDLRERLGPYWAAYQAFRRRERVFDDPDYVPEWFLARLARERVAAARVALEQLGREPMDVFQALGNPDMTRLHAALRTIEQFIRETNTLEPECAQVVAGLLGAQEVETARERRALLRMATPMLREMSDRQFVERVGLAKQHLRERGITTSGELAELHADEDVDRAEIRRAQWAALDAIAEEARA